MLKAADLKTLEKELEKAYSTLPLAEKPEDMVHGEGNEKAEVMLIGEAPGFYEARDRRPFIGRSGQLLRKVMKEVGIEPEKVFISNIVKVRPPENRDPSKEELLAYKPFLDKEIEIINPKLIVTLGRFSMAKFLPDVKISQVHGRLHKVKWNDSTLFILPMYHPAAALRATRVKNSFIEDFKKINKIINWVGDQGETIEFTQEVKEALF